VRGGRLIDFKFGLAADLINRSLIGELSHELVSLDIDVLLAWGSLRCLNIASKEFLSCFGALLLKSLGVIFALVSLEQLVGIGASWDNHSGVGTATEYTLIICDVLREVSLLIDLAVWVLIFLLLRNNARMGRKALATSCAI